MNERAGTSCWGWTLRALALLAMGLMLVYVFGGFEVTTALAP